MLPVTHGTRSRYRKGCRCEECTVANREYMRRFRARAQLRPDDWAHGLASTYSNFGCRCDACREAGLQEQREARARRAGIPTAAEEAHVAALLVETAPPVLGGPAYTLRGDRHLGTCVSIDYRHDLAVVRTRVNTLVTYPFHMVRAA